VTPQPPRPLNDEWEWQLQGACRRQDPELFFHSDNERGLARLHRERRAKQVCAGCPVLATCRAHALRAGEVFGIWGGLSEHERAQLQLRQRAQAG
jgi:WhiB family redox-sensing transcriptional regulator